MVRQMLTVKKRHAPMSQIDYGLTYLRHGERERQKRQPGQWLTLEHVLAKAPRKP